MTTDFDRLSAALEGRYTIERELGAGGMATVYLAHDVRHDRKVAVKVLRPELAAVIGAARFLTEIKVTANLQHPHILPLHDSGDADSFLFYVMPFVDGESLRDRLNRETQLSIEDALQISQEVADGLSHAHSLGVVHRDIKPENILLTGGHALIADFGIARAVTEAGGTRLTETGLSLGTPHYMSPEQASGERDVDARSDVYALGCVTYEMLVGEPPHTGPNAQAIIAKVLTEPVRSVRESRELVPPHVDSAIRKALAKLAADRWASTQQFGEALGRATGEVGDFQPAAAAREFPEPRRAGWLRVLPWSLLALITIVLAISMLRPEGQEVFSYGPVTRFTMALPEGYWLETLDGGLALSRDGSQLAYAARNEQGSVLFVRSLTDGYEARKIPGTDGGSSPFFSPNGEWVGFFTMEEGKLKKVLLSGGQPQDICDALWGGGSWGDNDTIVFGNWDYGIMRVPAAGGTPESLTEPWAFSMEAMDYQQLLPQILPGGEWVMFTTYNTPSNHRVEVLSLETRERRVLIEQGRHGSYLPTGHILYAWGGDLLAAPFDLDRMEVVGPSIPLEENVTGGGGGSASVAISDNGTLVFANGDLPYSNGTFVWVDMDGTADTLPIPPRSYMAARVSPDETRLLITQLDERYSLWIFDLIRGTYGPLTDQEADEAWATWTPSGDKIVANTNRLGGVVMNLGWVLDDGGGEVERLTSSSRNQFPYSWTPDGRVLAFGQLKSRAEGLDMDIWMLPLFGDSTPYPFLEAPFDETHASFSPDGNWLAYVSNESGRYEVYVLSFPAGETRTQLSISGGWEPVWAPDGSELYYRDFTGERVMGVTVDTERGFHPGSPRLLFEGPYESYGYRLGRSYDIAPDGSRFLMIAGPTERSAAPAELKVVVNWFSELQAKVPRPGS